jgi:hypothetical protein
MLTQSDMLRNLLSQSKLEFTRIKTVGEGIHAEVTDTQMNAQVIQLAQQSGWTVTRDEALIVAIEPGLPRSESFPHSFKFFHVSDDINRCSITTHGLEPRNGGNTPLNRVYENRVYLAKRLRDALQFVHFQITKNYNYTHGAKGKQKKKFAELDIFEVDCVPSAEYFVDDFFEGCGFWTNQLIPASYVRILDDSMWRHIYKGIYPEDFDETERHEFIKAHKV